MLFIFHGKTRTVGSSGFADGRHEVSPDSEQIEPAEAKPLRRNSVSVEQIQDSARRQRLEQFAIVRSTRSKLRNCRLTPPSKTVQRICVRIERSEIRIARKLSKLEPKVLLRNFPSVEQIQDKSHLRHHYRSRYE